MHHFRHLPDSSKSGAAARQAVFTTVVMTGIFMAGACLLSAQTKPAGSNAAHHGVSHPAAGQGDPAPQPEAAPKLTSMLELPATAASITTGRDMLSIHADNASLTQTLLRIADKTGMHLEGLGGDQRVFGTFGPGAPRDVLNALLDGTGYNVIMVGSLENGAPRQLILSQAKSGNASQPQSQPQPAQPAGTDDDANPDASSDDQAPIPPQTFTPPPGSEQSPPPNGNTPQQMLQQLQEMRQQQQQSAPQ